MQCTGIKLIHLQVGMGMERRLQMPRTVGLGHQNFKQLIQNDYFYIDKSLRKESKVVQTKKQL